MNRILATACGLCFGLFALSLLLTSCGGGNVLSPKFQPQVANLTDNFQFQATGVTNVTQTLNYTWQNTGTAASVNQATTVTGGGATLTIFDAGGTQAYTRSLADNGTFATASGTTGNWRINVVLSGYSGTINFRVQKNP
ncbi:MAG: hypothetical protein ACM3NO_10815 [Deltaproteobacteria bacterium]